MPLEDPLLFNVEWFDTTASLLRPFVLSFYESDSSVELVDTKLKRLFLRRTPCSGFGLSDLYVGNTVVIFSRHIVIKDYAHENTRSRIENGKQTTLVLLYPEAYDKFGHVLDALERGGFSLCRCRSVSFSITSANELFDAYRGSKDMGAMVSKLTSDKHPSIAMEIVGPNAICAWRQALPFADAGDIHGSASPEEAARELELLFRVENNSVRNSLNTFNPDPEYDGIVTCAIIKPHALRQGLAGRIIGQIQTAGFTIWAVQAFVMLKNEAEDFFEIYKGIPNEDYAGMVRQGSSGRCLVLALGGQPCDFRKLCGPSDPEIARVLAPDSLRAQYGGFSKEENAVHCSDLPEDGPMEVEYFFQILQPYHNEVSR